MTLPACGFYRTTASIADVPADAFVYFHNHGNPGPGIYRPTSWSHNRAQFSGRGTTLPDEKIAETLLPLPAEGLYRVLETFACCAKECQTYRPQTLVQLGYNAKGEGILFLPTLTVDGVTLPGRGTRIDDDRFSKLERLLVAQSGPSTSETSTAVH